MTPRDYQQRAIDDAAAWFHTAKPQEKRLYAAPTGSGKSVMELLLQDAVPGSWIVTPSQEIAAGMLAKRGVTVSGETALLDACDAHRICTPVRLRNRLLRGELAPPTALIFDEVQHHNAESWQQIDLLCGHCAAVGFTATPYRGTAKDTAVFRTRWGQPHWVLTYREAVARGVIAFPTCTVQPLVDDDAVTIRKGEFVIEEVSSLTAGKLADVVRLSREWCDDSGTDRPTMYAMPTVALAQSLTRELRDAGFPAVAVTGGTPYAERQRAFEDTVACRVALVQVQVVSEGVDLPLRRLVDLRPLCSPVAWLQMFGRISRPSETPPEYLCCNRNLLRHAYLLDGLLPAEQYKAAADALPPGKRNGFRVIGLEGLGRFKGVDVPLKDGLTGLFYCLASVSGNIVTEYAAIAHPLAAEPVWASRNNTRAADGITRSYGRWARCEPPEDVAGFASVPARAVTEKQLAWWKRHAGRFGLNADAAVNRKSFAVLPVLTDLNIQLLGV